MSGFGKGFSKSFESTQQRAHETRSDMFKVAYDDWTNKRSQYVEDESTWNKNVKAGELMAERYGAPKEAAIKAAEWLGAGYSMSDVDEMMSTTKFAVPDAVEEPTAVEDPNMDTQMADSGLEASASPLPDPVNQPNDQTPAKEPGVLDGLLDAASNIFPNAGKSPEAKAAGRLKESLGVTEEEFAQTNKGFTQPEAPTIEMSLQKTSLNPLAEFGLADGITDSKLKAARVEAAQGIKSDDPRVRAKAERFNAILPDILMAEEAMKDPVASEGALNVLKGTLDLRVKMGTERADIVSMSNEGKTLVDMVTQSNGRVTTLVGMGIAGFEGIKREANGIIGLFGGIIEDAGGDPAENTLLQAANSFVNGEIENGSYTAEEGRQVLEFHSAAIQYAYAVGRAMGQSGNGFSNKDFDNIYNSVIAIKDPIAFENNIKRLIQGQVSGINSRTTDLLSLAEMQVISTDYPEVYAAIEKDLKQVDTMMDKDVLTWLSEDFKKSTARKTNLEPNTNDATTPVETTSPVGQEKGTRRKTSSGQVLVFKGGDFNDPSNWEPEGQPDPNQVNDRAEELRKATQ